MQVYAPLASLRDILKVFLHLVSPVPRQSQCLTPSHFSILLAWSLVSPASSFGQTDDPLVAEEIWRHGVFVSYTNHCIVQIKMTATITWGAREREAKGLLWLRGIVKPNVQQSNGLSWNYRGHAGLVSRPGRFWWWERAFKPWLVTPKIVLENTRVFVVMTSWCFIEVGWWWKMPDD